MQRRRVAIIEFAKPADLSVARIVEFFGKPLLLGSQFGAEISQEPFHVGAIYGPGHDFGRSLEIAGDGDRDAAEQPRGRVAAELAEQLQGDVAAQAEPDQGNRTVTLARDMFRRPPEILRRAAV